MTLLMSFITAASPKAPLTAIIDTGASLELKDLKAKLWQNPREIPNNKIDDDGNGLIDDVSGWNFAANTPDISDKNGHGSHITSLIIPQATPGTLMILKYYDETKTPLENFKNCLAAFRYAIAQGAQIINFSGGGYGFNPEEHNLLRMAEASGVLIISAAGNDGLNNDRTPFYPASYSLKNILSVGSKSNGGDPSAFSNFGLQTVHLYYPGERVSGRDAKNNWTKMSGTSQATALATAEILRAQRKFSISLEFFPDKVKMIAVSNKKIIPEKLASLKNSNQSVFGFPIGNINSSKSASTRLSLK